MRAGRSFRTLGLLALAAGFVPTSLRPACGSEPAESSATVEVESALESLGSPFLREREEGVSRLIARGAEARGAVIAAFGGAPPDRRDLLVRVLAAEGSPESLDLLLSTLSTSDRPAARPIERALIEHAEAVEARLATWLGGKDAPPRIAELRAILGRARIERAFLSRKSRSGSTGSYKGQFDVLRPDRKEALAICLRILADEAEKIPGEYRAGGFRFLREPPFFVDPDDLRLMAGNAIGELIEEDDSGAIAQLVMLYEQLQGHRSDPSSAFADTILAILYRVGPANYRVATARRIQWLAANGRNESAAALLLRIHRYEEAIEQYQKALEDGPHSAIPYYNIACAYATWSAEETGVLRELHRKKAMQNLQSAVASDYADWPWLEQDRDLDPIRDMPEYVPLLAKIKAEFARPAALGQPPPGGEESGMDGGPTPKAPPR